MPEVSDVMPPNGFIDPEEANMLILSLNIANSHWSHFFHIMENKL